MMYYVIANKDNSKFIAIDSNSGYPYETNYFPHAKIGLYESINEEFKSLNNCGIDPSEYFIKKVILNFFNE